MPYFSNKSLAKLDTCTQIIQEIMKEAIEILDFAVTCGHRGEAEQNQAFAEGSSQLKWDDSKHNKIPADAVDVVPYPVEWPDIENDSKEEYARKIGRYYTMAGIILTIAHQKKVDLRWGGNWPNFKDYAHFELA